MARTPTQVVVRYFLRLKYTDDMAGADMNNLKLMLVLTYLHSQIVDKTVRADLKPLMRRVTSSSVPPLAKKGYDDGQIDRQPRYILSVDADRKSTMTS